MATNRSRYSELSDRTWLEDRYVNKMQPIGQIAEELGCAASSVARALARQGIEMRVHTSKYPQLNDKEWLQRAYVEDRKSTHQIAQEVGSTNGNVHSALIWAGIEVRGCKEAWHDKFPEGRAGDKHPGWKGGRKETKRRHTQYRERLSLAKDREKPPSGRDYWKGKTGKESAHWKGGRNALSAGYIYVYKPEHPNVTRHGYVMEHRLVAEEHLGRLLTRGEVVHHKNGNKGDNRWENLEVLAKGRHTSNHFEEGYRAEVLQEENANLKLRNTELEEELARYRNPA